MDGDINDRIQLIIDQMFKGNTSKFGRAVGVSQGTLSNILGKRRSSPSFDVLKNIIKTNELKINAEWLMTGEGEMLKSSEQSASEDEVAFLRRIVVESSHTIASQQDTIHELTLLLKKPDVLRAGTACSADAANSNLSGE
jgi:transcriptional regulator with XRE-family HTH domain